MEFTVDTLALISINYSAMEFKDTILYDWDRRLEEIANDASDIVVLSDSNTSVHCLPIFKERFKHEFKSIEIPSGESNKNLDTAKEVWKKMVSFNLDRNALMLTLGGGVVTDLGGYCASVYKRGIDCVHIPTTLLSMVDAAIGGKNGIDFMHLKNYLGTIRLPKAVLIDPTWLYTLPEKETRSGAAEMIKAALIYDLTLWRKFQQITNIQGFCDRELIQKSVAIKQEIVMRDPYEKGLRKTLNFGHTIGHAIESFYMKSSAPLTHGDAVALGMLLETKYVSKYVDPSSGVYEEIRPFIEMHYPTLPKLNEENIEQIIRYMLGDKKNKGNVILSVLLREIGSPTWDLELKPDEVKELLRH